MPLHSLECKGTKANAGSSNPPVGVSQSVNTIAVPYGVFDSINFRKSLIVLGLVNHYQPIKWDRRTYVRNSSNYR